MLETRLRYSTASALRAGDERRPVSRSTNSVAPPRAKPHLLARDDVDGDDVVPHAREPPDFRQRTFFLIEIADHDDQPAAPEQT